MKRIFLVRNAEHALAPLDSWPSDDTGLTKDGRYQAIDIGKVLATCHLTALYSSNRERAKQTAAPTVRRVGLDISYLSNFDAVPLGAYAGLTYREIRDKLGEIHDEILTTPDSTKDYLETGITLDIAAQKAWNELENVARAARNNTSVAIFTHDEIIGALLCKITKMPLKMLWWWGGREEPTRYGSITELTYAKNYEWSLVKFGCTAHLMKK